MKWNQIDSADRTYSVPTGEWSGDENSRGRAATGLVAALRQEVAAQGCDCRSHTGRLRDSRVAGVCLSGRIAATVRHLLLPGRWSRLCAVWYVASIGRRANLG